MAEEEKKAAAEHPKPKHHHHTPHKETKELDRRLKKEIAPFTIKDLPLTDSDSGEEELFATRYLFQKVLGAGSFGVVISAVDRTHLEECAIKIISKDLAGNEVMEKLNLEAEVLGKLDHPNIVKFLKLHESHYHYFIVMELVKGGSLADFVLHRQKLSKSLTEDECRVIMKQILQGLNYIHSNNILHRDLKPANILMRSFESIPNSIKIADFGLCAQLSREYEANPSERCGTRCYMAPEQIQGKSYWKGIDIWAAGIILYILLTGKHPFYKREEKTNRYLGKMLNPTWNHAVKCSEAAKDLLDKMCNPNVLNRYSAAEAMQHPWLTGDLTAPAPLTCMEQFLSNRLKAAFEALFFLSTCHAFTAPPPSPKKKPVVAHLPLNRINMGTDSDSPAGSPARALKSPQPRGYSLTIHKRKVAPKNSPMLSAGKKPAAGKPAPTVYLQQF